MPTNLSRPFAVCHAFAVPLAAASDSSCANPSRRAGHVLRTVIERRPLAGLPAGEPPADAPALVEDAGRASRRPQHACRRQTGHARADDRPMG